MKACWWQSRAFVAVCLILSMVPLLWPAIPPLTDLPGHIGRYRILSEAGQGPLAAHFGVRWAVIGNLGVDLIVLALHPVLDVEPAAKLAVMAIPVLSMGGMLWLAREAHGRIPPTAAFALPLAYGWAFQLGFVNFCLAQALVFVGLAAWLHLARTRATWVRIVAFAVFAPLVWLCHSFGWAMLGLFAGMVEWRRRIAAGEPVLPALLRAGAMVAPMASPVLLMLHGHADALSGDTGDWFDWGAKLQWVIALFRERWKAWDVAGLLVMIALLYTGIRSPRLRVSGLLGWPALAGLATFILLPRLFQGGAYVDMRMLAPSLALAILAIAPAAGEDRLAARLAGLATMFFVARIAVTTLAFAQLAEAQARPLRAVPVLPIGGTVLTLVNEPPASRWGNDRLTHVAGLAIARRRIFTNQQWALAGQQLVHPRHPRAAPFDRDPSHIVYPPGMVAGSTDFDVAIRTFDRCSFALVWTIGFPPGRAQATDLSPVWSDGASAVYRVRASRCLSRSPSVR
ncbi:hypothetical protein [uncultured Sphingomonas sp.]|uniref:hypothetical protein n=1 Tax=uncultured Sphingomonas sp. TaxID=158754 RepID=UPI0026196B91|nr:hypothetical protein [uncultured Sphingomonas sp.]